jgi:uncharacterized protein (DUF1501 family)
MNRREFLRAGALSAGALPLVLAERAESSPTRGQDLRCILLFLVGGPSHLDTWDPKPLAPEEIRGPFRPIRTRVPGLHLGEHFPLMAERAHRFALVRSVHHDEAPIHETGHQLLQTGRLTRAGVEFPHYGAMLSHLLGPTSPETPPFVVLPTPIGNTGVSVGHGQGAGFLGSRHAPLVLPANADPSSGPVRRARALDREWTASRARYGDGTFGRSCLLARRLVEEGVRLVTVNMFESVFNEVTWDCHADSGSLASTLDDYKNTLCPMFDRAWSALIDDLHERGLLDTTLVLAMGEFGRTPRLNARGGRDHWPGVWSIVLAGGGVRGGQVVGCSDRHGTEPRDRPVTPAELAATVYRSLGIPTGTHLTGPDGLSVPLVEADPIAELF